MNEKISPDEPDPEQSKRPPDFPPHYLEQLIESSPDIVIAVDHGGRVVFYNDGAEKNLGYSPSEVRGQPVTKLYPSIDEARRVMSAMRGEANGGPSKVKNFATVFVDRWGREIPVAISGSILFDDGGFEIGSIGFAKDLREIQGRERLATLGEVAVAVCHEINNPLEVILNQVDLLATFVRKAASDEAALVEEDRIAILRREIEKIQEIVERLEAKSHGEDYDTCEYHGGTKMTDLKTRPSKPGSTNLQGLRVLVVDDDPGICRSLSELLAGDGCEVRTAGGGVEALQIFDAYPIDVVVSDVVMPDLDGYQLFTAIKERGDTPVLLMTGYYHDQNHIIKRSRLKGLEGVLFKKPVDPDRLRTLLVQVRAEVQGEAAKTPAPADPPLASAPPRSGDRSRRARR